MKQYSVLIFLLMSVGVTSVKAQKKSNENATLFTINSKPVSSEEFIYLYKKNHQNKAEEFTKPKIEEYLDLFVNFKLKVAEAESRKMDIAPEFTKELNTYKEELKKPFVAETDVLTRLVKEAYDRMGQEIKASHILFTLKPDATPEDTLKAYNKSIEVRQKALNGEEFEKLAREFSEDPSAKSNGGKLGYFSALQMVFPFEEAAYSMDVGEVSQPVRTRFGYHLIKVEDKRPARGEVEVSHILIRGADDETKKKIDELYDKLKNGGAWEELCKEFSQDPNTKNSEGKLRPFAPGALASTPQFEEAAFSLKEPGAISRPVQTSFGWHIIRLERKIPLPAFSDMEESLKRRVARDDRMNISKSRALEKRKREFQYKESPQLKKLIELFADSSLVKGKWTKNKLETDEDTTMFSLGGSNFGINNFDDYILQNQTQTNMTPSLYALHLYEQWVEKILNDAEDVKLQKENPEYKSLVNEYREGILLFSIMEKEIWNKASEDSLGQRRYYDTNTEKYKADLRIEARIFETDSKVFLDSMKAKVESGDSLTTEDAKRFKTIARERAYEKGENKAIDSINWTIGLHQTEADGMYYLVEVNRLVPPGIKKFSEVRASVISDYQDYLEKKWIEQLKEKYPVKINSKIRKKVIARLTSITEF